jgi:hypothetical protein
MSATEWTLASLDGPGFKFYFPGFRYYLDYDI